MSLENLWYHGSAISSILVDLILIVVASLAYQRFHLTSLIFLALAFGLFFVSSCYAYWMGLVEMGIIPWEWDYRSATISYIGGSLNQGAANILLAISVIALARHAFRQRNKDYISYETKE